MSHLDEIEAIKQLKYRYFRGVDMADLDVVRDCFVERASVLYVGGAYRVELSGRDKIVEYIASAMHSECISGHIGTGPEITLTSPTTAKGTWYQHDWFLDLRTNVKLSGACLYNDQYVKEDGQWRILSSGYERVHEIVEQLAAKPTITAHYLGKHARKPA